MKSLFMCLILVVVAVVMGSGIGYGISWFEYGTTEEHFFADQWGVVGQHGDGSAGVIDFSGKKSHDFGAMVAGQEYEAEFVAKNSGGSSVEISVAEKSENVTVDLSEKYSLTASTTYPIGISVVAPDKPGDFEGFVVLKTSDPNPARQTIRLTVLGRVGTKNSVD